MAAPLKNYNDRYNLQSKRKPNPEVFHLKNHLYLIGNLPSIFQLIRVSRYGGLNKDKLRQTQTHWHCFTLEDRYKITAILGSIINRGSNLSPWIGWQKNDLLWTIFACIFCVFFLVFRRTVDQSEIFLSLKPSAFQGESPLKIWAH